MSIALNLNSQIETIRRDKIITGGSPWGKGFAMGVGIAMIIMLPLFLLYYSLTAPRIMENASGETQSQSVMTLRQYAASPIPAPAPKDYLGS